MKREDLRRLFAQARKLSGESEFVKTAFLDAAESARARKALDEDREWLRPRRPAKR